VGDGAAAVAAVKARPFDLVLMDVQMPEMDGLEATAAIRAWEQGRGVHVPIVAMTARAMKGDRETCLAAGMDGYVAKPIQPEELRETIRAVLGLGPGSGGVPAVRPDGPPLCADRSALPSSFDPGPALYRVGGNHALLRDLLRLFLRECPELLDRIREGLDRGNAPQVREAAHNLKGSAANFVSGEVVLAAQALERLGASGDLSGGHAHLQSLECSLQQLCQGLERWLAATTDSAVAR
jgi:CheY-like chemotaxis protein